MSSECGRGRPQPNRFYKNSLNFHWNQHWNRFTTNLTMLIETTEPKQTNYLQESVRQLLNSHQQQKRLFTSVQGKPHLNCWSNMDAGGDRHTSNGLRACAQLLEQRPYVRLGPAHGEGRTEIILFLLIAMTSPCASHTFPQFKLVSDTYIFCSLFNQR